MKDLWANRCQTRVVVCGLISLSTVRLTSELLEEACWGGGGDVVRLPDGRWQLMGRLDVATVLYSVGPDLFQVVAGFNIEKKKQCAP